ncbi:glycosyltransferase [Stenomitos frigidus]|uniref:Glycosyltransferase family 1 protein n=1 Tax=Stenomitos frigidus ULC18 TaxID=2107698 RepID=A0A2T1E1S3_9CYAN|nr:glycosyltransferase family 1 protein [Stenomitos frigidus]PSB26689.1 hypothetical protein C7B82_18995 [Stenomitos frigidus ULC18]
MHLYSSTTINPYFTDEQKPLERLPHPVYFVTKEPKWQGLISNPEQPIDSALYEQCVVSEDIWSAQTFMNLKKRGLNVHLVPKLVPGSICIVPFDYIYLSDLSYRSYVVVVQYDRPHPEICEQRIVLNKVGAIDPTHHFMPHWPQPNLEPRDPLRGTRVENMTFKGNSYNLTEEFRDAAFLESLKALQMKLVLSSEEVGFNGWRDYKTADVVIAVRNITKYDSTLKPALKLTNAWFAGCPAILSPEPAYQALRQSELDYIEVKTAEEAIAALKRLQDEPKLYAAMVENGFRRASEFTEAKVALYLRHLLADPIAQGYEQWLRQSPLQKFVGRPLQHVGRILKQRQERDYYRTHIYNGPRLLDRD